MEKNQDAHNWRKTEKKHKEKKRQREKLSRVCGET